MKNAGVGMQTIKFSVEDRSWGNEEKYELLGVMSIGVGAELGEVLGHTVNVYESVSVNVDKLPREIQERLITVYRDIDKFILGNQNVSTPVG